MEKYIQIIYDKIIGWGEAFVAHIPNILVASLALGLFYLASLLVCRIARKILFKLTDSHAIVNLALTVIKITVIGIGLILALGILGLQETVFSLLAGVGIAGLALGFAFQDLASNFISGIFLAFRRPFQEGDIIKTNSYIGTVKKLNIRNTILENFFGQLIYIPNKEVFQTPLTNYSSTGFRRIEIKVGVSYNCDIEKVESIAKKTLQKLDFCQDDKDVVAWTEEFGGSSVNLSLRFWINSNGDTAYPTAKSLALNAIKKAFEEHDIGIPYPVRTLDLSMAEKQDLNLVLPEKKSA